MNTENKKQDLSSLSTDLKRALALLQFKGKDFFVLNDVPYEGTLEDAEEQFSQQDEQTREEGLHSFVDVYFNEIEETDGDYSSIDGEDYYVLTDSEADDKWEEYLDNYIDECLDIPEHIRNYFDEEAWKSDARMDGRGNSLAHYDGYENEETIGDETFYIYRVN